MVATADVTIIGYNHGLQLPCLNCDWIKNKDMHAVFTSVVIYYKPLGFDINIHGLNTRELDMTKIKPSQAGLSIPA